MAALRTAGSASTTSLSLRSVVPNIRVAAYTGHCEYTEGACEQGKSSRQHFDPHDAPRRQGGVGCNEDRGRQRQVRRGRFGLPCRTSAWRRVHVTVSILRGSVYKRRRVDSIFAGMKGVENKAVLRTAGSTLSTSLWLRSAVPDVSLATCTCHCECLEGACVPETSSREHFDPHDGRRRRREVTQQ